LTQYSGDSGIVSEIYLLFSVFAVAFMVFTCI